MTIKLTECVNTACMGPSKAPRQATIMVEAPDVGDMRANFKAFEEAKARCHVYDPEGGTLPEQRAMSRLSRAALQAYFAGSRDLRHPWVSGKLDGLPISVWVARWVHVGALPMVVRSLLEDGCRA